MTITAVKNKQNVLKKNVLELNPSPADKSRLQLCLPPNASPARSKVGRGGKNNLTEIALQ